MQALRDHWRDARARAESGGESAVLLDRFLSLVDGLEAKAADGRTREEHRTKVAEFLGTVRAAYERLGDQLFQPSYLLNVVGDAFVRANLPAEEALELMRVGLYFHGLRVVDRRFANRATVYYALHADLLESFFSRDAVKRTIAAGKAKIAAGKVFCLTYHYVNELKKAYWAHLRKAEDALDHAASEDAAFESATADDSSADAVDPTDRVGLMMEIFRRKLTATQQVVYLAKNRNGESAAAMAAYSGTVDDEFVRLLRGLDAELAGHGNLGWSEIAERLDINEKSAKREYLRALHTLLHESARAVFGLDIESAYVRRVLAQLREIVYEKDLRIRSNAGEGLARLVEKWEVALRFVLNHGRVPA
jgi:hypothetical protein